MRDVLEVGGGGVGGGGVGVLGVLSYKVGGVLEVGVYFQG